MQEEKEKQGVFVGKSTPKWGAGTYEATIGSDNSIVRLGINVIWYPEKLSDGGKNALWGEVNESTWLVRARVTIPSRQ